MFRASSANLQEDTVPGGLVAWWPVDTQLEFPYAARVLTLAAYQQATRNSYRE